MSDILNAHVPREIAAKIKWREQKEVCVQVVRGQGRVWGKGRARPNNNSLKQLNVLVKGKRKGEKTFLKRVSIFTDFTY